MNNEFLLMDRLQKIKQVITEYGEDNFYISFSGGKDSTVLSELVDMAIPSNSIPRVYANTGLDYDLIHKFVLNKIRNDSRFEEIKPTVPVIPMLKEYGYPFKSKIHSMCVYLYQNAPERKMWQGYTGQRPETWHTAECPKILRYQFNENFNLKISDKCCVKMKEEPLKEWAIKNNKSIYITGIVSEEFGRRTKSSCLLMQGTKLKAFQPLIPITKEWEEWYINRYNIEICEIYKEPYNFDRTGCKGCPFAINLQEELDTLERYFPNERKQCEIIWAPVYAEYRRLKYRLKK